MTDDEATETGPINGEPPVPGAEPIGPQTDYDHAHDATARVRELEEQLAQTDEAYRGVIAHLETMTAERDRLEQAVVQKRGELSHSDQLLKERNKQYTRLCWALTYIGHLANGRHEDYVELDWGKEDEQARILVSAPDRDGHWLETQFTNTGPIGELADSIRSLLIVDARIEDAPPDWVDEIDIGNHCLVGATVGGEISINHPAAMTGPDAVVTAAWLLAVAEMHAPDHVTHFDAILEAVRNT